MARNAAKLRCFNMKTTRLDLRMALEVTSSRENQTKPKILNLNSPGMAG